MVSGLPGRLREGALVDAKKQFRTDRAARQLAEGGLADQDDCGRLRTEHASHGPVTPQRVANKRVIVDLAVIVLAELAELVPEALAVAALGRAGLLLTWWNRIFPPAPVGG